MTYLDLPLFAPRQSSGPPPLVVGFYAGSPARIVDDGDLVALMVGSHIIQSIANVPAGLATLKTYMDAT